jgi:hypothetical protein
MELMNDNEIKNELDRIISSMQKCGLSGCEEEMFTMGFNHFKRKIYDKLRESQKLSTSDEALPIGDVVGRSEQLKNQMSDFEINHIKHARSVNMKRG